MLKIKQFCRYNTGFFKSLKISAIALFCGIISACPIRNYEEEYIYADIPTIGNVATYIPSTNSDTTRLSNAAAGLTVGDDQIGIVIDTSTSLFPTSSWTSHKVFMLGAFGGFTLGGNPMANWAPKSYMSNLMTVTTNPDVWTIVISVPTAFATNTNSRYTLDFKPANYLNTIEGTNTLISAGDPLSIIGYLWTGVANAQIVMTNDAGVIKIAKVGIDGTFTYEGQYIDAAKKVAGIVVNDSFADWSIQSAGMPEIPAGTKVRFIWHNVPTGNIKPVNGLIWTTFPEGAVITGDQTWMHTTNVTWYPTVGKSVGEFHFYNSYYYNVYLSVPPPGWNYIYRGLYVDVVISSNTSPGFQMRMANIAGWSQGEEINNHRGLISSPLWGWSTIIVNANFKTTNI